MSCHCVSGFLAVGGACLSILWLGNKVLHGSQHSQFGIFISIAFSSDYHVGNAGPLIGYAVGSGSVHPFHVLLIDQLGYPDFHDS